MAETNPHNHIHETQSGGQGTFEASREAGGFPPAPPRLPNNQRTLAAADEGAAIVRNIASFLTFSDVTSIASVGGGGDMHFVDSDVTPADSWVVDSSSVGEDFSWSVATPPTPALVAVSPGATPAANFCTFVANDDDEEDSVYLEHVLEERRRIWAKEKLTSAVFSHPQPLRSFCLDAYSAAQDIRKQQENREAAALNDDGPETLVEPRKPKRKKSRNELRLMLMHSLVDMLFRNVPLSVLFDVADALVGVSLDTTFATFQLTIKSINGTISALAYAVCVVWDAIITFNPFQLLEAIISIQFNAMGKTSEVLVSGIQSVATGVGSASSIALHRLSAANLSISGVNGPSSSQVPSGDGSARRGRGTVVHNTALNKKLLRKMSSLNEAARVVAYREMSDDTGGLTRHAISRTRRMMHYSVSLRPFVATVAVKPSEAGNNRSGYGPDSTGDHNIVESGMATLVSDGDASESSTHGSVSPTSKGESPLICSPQSFPPTPRSRQMVLARGSQFADDVVFLARDRLRIHDGLENNNERTREMAWALREGKRLAIFDGNGVNGIELTCGQHIATKVGNMHYARYGASIFLVEDELVLSFLTLLLFYYHPQPSVPIDNQMAA